MSPQEFIQSLGGWEGYQVINCELVKAPHRPKGRAAHVRLRPDPAYIPTCSGCHKKVSAIHETCTRLIQDLPIFDHTVFVVVPRRRLNCPRCGHKLEELPWLAAYSRVTKRLAESVGLLCKNMAIKHVAKLYDLPWDTVKAIDKAYMSQSLGTPDLTGIEILAMDEFAIHKGHRYATVIVEPYRRRVLWVGPGRDRESIRPFLEALGEEGRRKLKAVAMDMNASYELEIKAWCPQAKIVFDFFHVVAKYGRDVIRRVRVDEADKLKHDKPARKVIKGANWLLLRNRENVTRPDEQLKLEELLAANRAICAAYLLKEDLKQLFQFRQEAAALRFWKGWYQRAVRSRIPALVRFAKRLKGYLHGILAHCSYPIGTSFLEGMNNKIKVIKRMAYGFRDDEYFFLKVRAAFPGIPG